MNKTYSAGGVVINDRGEVLLTNQKGNSWSLPKGHIDPGEDKRTASEREINEETGINQLKFIKDLGTYERLQISKDGHGENPEELKSITMFLYTTNQDKLAPTDPTHPEARWVNQEQASTMLTHPKDQEFFASIINEIEKISDQT